MKRAKIFPAFPKNFNIPLSKFPKLVWKIVIFI